MSNPAITPRPVDWNETPGPCPVCETPYFKVLGRRGGHAHRAGRGVAATVVRCDSCHLVYCQPSLRPIGNPYSTYAGDEYFTGHDSTEKVRNGRSLIAKAETMLGRKGKVLELGCGRGELLKGASDAGWTAFGVDQTPQFADAARARGVHVELSSLEASSFLRRPDEFDVIFLAAILEHLYDPVACLKSVHRSLVPGGLVFIDVPNECSFRTSVGNLYMRLRGRDWAVNLSPTFPPFHVVGFCPDSLRRALRESGLEEAELQVVSWPDSLPPQAGLWSRLERAGSGAVHRLARLAGGGDGLVCWARKPR